MDFEEQLQKAEKSPYPSLVGASVKSADDSPHNNYIHPEKYTGTSSSKTRPGKKSLLNSSIGASLDDLISEGALLGSDEDFDRFLDDKGNVLSDAKFSKEKSTEKPAAQTIDEHKPAKSSGLKQEARKTLVEDDSAVLSPVGSAASEATHPGLGETKPLAELENYSTPNLSEYQIGHQISDHAQLLDSVKSYDLSKLPTSDDNESRSKTTQVYPQVDKTHKPIRPTNLRANSGIATNTLDAGQNVQVSEPDSLHTPFFHSEERSSSRSRSRVAFRERSPDRSRSTSKSAMVPHLARGDSYKNTHEETPSKYELPAGMEVEEDEEPDDRRSRQSKPTLGDSIAAAEAIKSTKSDTESITESITESVTRDPSLVTSGDYTNFNADGHEHALKGSNLYSLRSESSTNYLRSISRSRSRKPAHEFGSFSTLNEKNDANPQELEREGALVSDDPYSQVDDLDNMMKRVLKGSEDNASSKSKNLVNDVSAESKNTETKKQLTTKSDPPAASDKIEVGKDVKEGDVSKSEVFKSDSKSPKGSEETKTSTETSKIPAKPDTSLDTDVTASKKVDDKEEIHSTVKSPVVNDVSAKEKDIETKDQLKAEKAPTVSATDIHVADPKTETAKESVTYADKSLKTDPVTEKEVNDVSAEKKELEAHEQLKAQEAPTVSASDIKTSDVVEKSDAKSATETHSSTAKALDSKAGAPLETKLTEDQPVSASKTKEQISTEKSKDELGKKEVESSGAKTITEEITSILPGANAIKEGVKGLFADSSEKKATADEGKHDLAGKPDALLANGSKSLNVEASAKGKPVEEEEEFEVSPEELRKHLESLPVYLYTSLAGGMQIITRTNRLATILQANGIKFEHRDLGTDEEAKKLWRRYAQGKTLPGVVRGDDFIGNWEFIEEVNEDYRLKEVLHETL